MAGVEGIIAEDLLRYRPRHQMGVVPATAFLLIVLTPWGLTSDPRQGTDAPSKIIRWQRTVFASPELERVAAELQRSHLSSGFPPIPACEPVIVSGTVLSRSGNQLLGIDYRSGEAIWEFPWYEVDPPDADSLDLHLWLDTVHSQIGTDGTHVFAIHDLGDAEPSSQQKNARQGSQRGRGAMPYNTLVALDATRLGKLEWMIGGMNGYNEPLLKGVFFLGVPKQHNDCLYVLAERIGKIQLLVLRRHNGRLVSSVDIQSIGEETDFACHVRRLAGSPLAFADGVIICPTQLGELVAIDTEHYREVWRHKYSSDLPPYSRSLSLAAAYERGGWIRCGIFVAAGKVVVAPTDTDELICLVERTGDVAWRKTPEGAIAVAGIHGELIVMLEKHGLRAIRLTDGQDCWEVSLNDAMPCGRGVFHSGSYYLPTSVPDVVQINVENGAIIGRAETHEMLGNLVLGDGDIVSQSAVSLTALKLIPD